jgi:histidine triad (HIT) family protein
MYQANNIFAKILRGEVLCQKIMENDDVLVFYDINPKAPIHALVICKGSFKNALEFHKKATDQQIIQFYKGINEAVAKLDLSSFRLVSNTGHDAGQLIDHFHVHILGGGLLSDAP